MNKYLELILLTIMFICLITFFSKNTYPTTFNYKKINDYLIKLEHTSDGHSQCLKQFQQRLLEIEQELDYLRGQIQDNEHQLLKITEQQNNIVKKIHYFESKNFDCITNLNERTQTTSKYDSSTTYHKNDNHSIEYNKAVNLVLEKKEYEKAIQMFQEFISKYPHSIYQANAYYWLGQLNYRKGNKNNASHYFSLVAKNYPKSSKASDALLKVGIIMEETGYKKQAQLIYKKVNDLYPNTDASKHSKKRLNN